MYNTIINKVNMNVNTSYDINKSHVWYPQAEAHNLMPHM